MTLQQTLWGGSVNLTPIEDKVERVLEEHPETRGSDKALILKVWLEEDGLADVLRDEALAERFAQWFIDQATYTESITRTRRALQAEGFFRPEAEHQARREARQEAWRQHYRR